MTSVTCVMSVTSEIVCTPLIPGGRAEAWQRALEASLRLNTGTALSTLLAQVRMHAESQNLFCWSVDWTWYGTGLKSSCDETQGIQHMNS
jgi:hypothetical protein